VRTDRLRPHGRGGRALAALVALVALAAAPGTPTSANAGPGRAPGEAGRVLAAPAAVTFEGAVAGTPAARMLYLYNSGGRPLTVTGVDAPAAPFTLTGLPALGATLAPGRHIDVAVRFAPPAAGAWTGELRVRTTAGTTTVALSGTAAPSGRLVLEPASLDLGAVTVGQSAIAAVVARNDGDAPLAILASTPPVGGPFAVLDGLDAGTVLAPGASRTLRVRFAPDRPGAATAPWSILAGDAGAAHTLALTGTGLAAPAAPPAPPQAPVAALVAAGPELASQATGPLVRLRPRLTLARPRFARGDAGVRLAGRAAPQAAGALGITLTARVGGRTRFLVTSIPLRGGRFAVTLALPRALRGWTRLRIEVRFAGSDGVWPGRTGLVVVRG
jgi:hypothetical protein